MVTARILVILSLSSVCARTPSAANVSLASTRSFVRIGLPNAALDVGTDRSLFKVVSVAPWRNPTLLQTRTILKDSAALPTLGMHGKENERSEAAPGWVTEIDIILDIRRASSPTVSAAARPRLDPTIEARDRRLSHSGGRLHTDAQREKTAMASQKNQASGQPHVTPATPLAGRPHPKVVGIGRIYPKRGLLVQRGPDWRWGDQDGGFGSVGTITDETRNGWCNVRWPSGHENGYRAGDGGHFDLLLADQKNTPARDASPAPRNAPRGDETLRDARPGQYVHRGPDWRWGSQDGTPGALGVVVGVEKDAWVRVRWPSGMENGYRFGNAGMFDVVLARAGGGVRRKTATEGVNLEFDTVRDRPRRHIANGKISAQNCNAPARVRCWCIDQFGGVLPLN